MGVLCVLAGVALIVKLWGDDTSVWGYVVAIQLVIVGGFLIAFGYASFING
jgi:hypothetical protein